MALWMRSGSYNHRCRGDDEQLVRANVHHSWVLPDAEYDFMHDDIYMITVHHIGGQLLSVHEVTQVTLPQIRGFTLLYGVSLRAHRHHRCVHRQHNSRYRYGRAVVQLLSRYTTKFY